MFGPRSRSSENLSPFTTWHVFLMKLIRMLAKLQLLNMTWISKLSWFALCVSSLERCSSSSSRFISLCFRSESRPWMHLMYWRCMDLAFSSESVRMNHLEDFSQML